MRKEIKIGLYAVVILLAAWAGIRFLSGVDVLGRSNTYHAHYAQVDGLQDAASVVVNGVKVGQVTGVKLNLEKGGADITLSVSSEINIPNDSKAAMYSAGLMGGKAIEIKLGKSTDYLQNGDNIQTEVTLDMVSTLTNELGSIKESVTTLINNVNQTVIGVDSLIDGNSKNITYAIANLTSIMAELKRSKIVSNIDGFCATLNQNSAKLDSIITNVNSVTTDLNEQNVIENINKTITEVETLLAKVNSGTGSVGNLISDEKLYKELAQASQNLSNLLADLKENPKRYINVTVFGKKSYEEKQADKAARQADKEKKKAAKQTK